MAHLLARYLEILPQQVSQVQVYLLKLLCPNKYHRYRYKHLAIGVFKEFFLNFGVSFCVYMCVFFCIAVPNPPHPKHRYRHTSSEGPQPARQLLSPARSWCCARLPTLSTLIAHPLLCLARSPSGPWSAPLELSLEYTVSFSD